MGVMPKNPTKTPVPEHSLRHREDNAILSMHVRSQLRNVPPIANAARVVELEA
jgi:hypothetical protein